MAAAAATTTASILSATRSASTSGETPSASNIYSTSFRGTSLRISNSIKRSSIKINGRINAAVTVATTAVEEVKEYALPTWAQFDLGRAPVYWKTTNGLLPSSGERLRIFYNPAANKVAPNEQFGIAFNGGFNQPIMCGGEPRVMLQKTRGKADPPIYIIQICVPKHALSLIFSFTNGTEWDGPYRLQFQVPKPWRNKPTEFFTEGLAEELSKEGACDRAIFPDANTVITTCAMVGNLTTEGGDRCNLNLVPGCTDPSSPLYDPLANVDDGSCPPYSDSED